MSGCAAWQGAAERLRRGAELLAKRLDQDDRYYAAAAELQKRWKLKVLAPVSFLITPSKRMTQETHLISADIQCSVGDLHPPTQDRSTVTGIKCRMHTPAALLCSAMSRRHQPALQGTGQASVVV